jgi:hypothetical protein
VGVTYSNDGKTGTLWEKNNGNWVEYMRIGGSSKFSCSVGSAYWGNGYNLGNWYSTYKWNADKGYENFSSWVK